MVPPTPAAAAKRTPQKVVCCRVCEQEFPSKSLLRAHLAHSKHYDARAIPMNKLSCRFCNESFESKSLLGIHTTRIHDNLFQYPRQGNDATQHSKPKPRKSWPPANTMMSQKKEQAIAWSRRQKLAQFQADTSQEPVGLELCGPRHVILDMDNILYGMRFSHVYERVEDAQSGDELRMNIKELTKLLGGQEAQKTTFQAIYARTSPNIAAIFEQCGWQVTRPSNHARDTLLQWLVQDCIKPGSNTSEATTTIALVTGDSCAFGSPQSDFRLLLNHHLASGRIKVEVHTWLHALHESYLEILSRHPTRMTILPLEDRAATILYRYCPWGAQEKHLPVSPVGDEEGKPGELDWVLLATRLEELELCMSETSGTE
ncbi:hypothetical protein Poli38472_007683 [Pythium oligandrum]|uniref:C2H2-type domain-containing protein n=1 Tax=Pythium oligandrum TaxID=41045 RepID=A0A8K1FM99_PYTOL|nr:hypothetical protein Poli38472_007683 [Pythium oligandrum]|eukprot:TMW68011.1 hypothetical protein Poli38472_007683 [Pythium oligandrum]